MLTGNVVYPVHRRRREEKTFKNAGYALTGTVFREAAEGFPDIQKVNESSTQTGNDVATMQIDRTLHTADI